MTTPTKRALARLSFFFGGALILAGMVDLLAYTWGRNSPWPWYVNIAYMAAGILLLFPDKLGLAKDWAKELLPWFRSKGG